MFRGGQTRFRPALLRQPHSAAGFSAEREEEVFPGRERGLRAGDKLVFTAVSYDFKEAEEELVNYFGPQEAVWKEN